MEESENKVRKASDVLIELEQKVDTLLKFFNLLDSNVKIVMHRQNQLMNLLEKAISGNDELINEMQPYAPLTPASADLAIIDADEPVIQTETLPKGARRGARSGSEVGKGSGEVAFPVFQKVIDLNNKIIYMADIEIMDSDKNLVMKTKSNAGGKWQAGLKIGSYYVSAFKKGPKKLVSLMNSFKIYETDSVIELEPLVLKEQVERTK